MRGVNGLKRFALKVPLLPVSLALASAILFAEKHVLLSTAIAASAFVLGAMSRRHVLLVTLFVAWLGLGIHRAKLLERDAFAEGLGQWWRGEVQVVDIGRYGQVTLRLLESETPSVRWRAYFEDGAGPRHIGDCLYVHGAVHPLKPALNPAEFDQESWLRRQGVVAELRVVHYEYRGDARVSMYWRARTQLKDWALRARAKVAGILSDGVSEDAAVILPAMVLGQKPAHDDPMSKHFRLSGAMHVFAVSGLHVMMVGSLVALLLRFVGGGPRVWVLGAIGAMFAYAMVTGMRPPAMRAACMGAVLLLGILVNRRVVLMNSIAASALCIVLSDTHALFQVGFQLSFIVLVAIALCSEWTQRAFAWVSYHDPFMPYRLMGPRQHLGLRLRRGLQGTLSISACALIGATPLSLHYFQLATPVSMLTSIPLVLMLYFLLANAMATVLLGLFWPVLATQLNSLSGAVADCGYAWVRQMAELPAGHWSAKPWQRGERLVVYALPYDGAAAYWSLGGGCLIDTGSSYSYRRCVRPSLVSYGAPIDSLILTHADSQHCGGVAELATEWRLKQAATPEGHFRSKSYHHALSSLTDQGLDPVALHPGQVLPVGPDASVEVIDAGSADAAIADDACLVLMLRWRELRVLVLGDSGFRAHQRILKRYPKLRADVLVLGKHRRDPEPSASWLRSMEPKLIVTPQAMESLEGVSQHILSKQGAWMLHALESGWEMGALHTDE
ncbi:ComEC/Rec2 family competence protein [Rubritalea marina]|uniref:ComEC/Rec2 family competence protein n=1 Tax=Rubritalea marina TaxID=361055 RepID=UPI0003607C94|nr:ComEC/Rec2 family competence protein [Rubritalea marina]